MSVRPIFAWFDLWVGVFDMLNAKTVRIGYPGHLYVLPFFITRAAS